MSPWWIYQVTSCQDLWKCHVVYVSHTLNSQDLNGVSCLIVYTCNTLDLMQQQCQLWLCPWVAILEAICLSMACLQWFIQSWQSVIIIADVKELCYLFCSLLGKLSCGHSRRKICGHSGHGDTADMLQKDLWHYFVTLDAESSGWVSSKMRVQQILVPGLGCNSRGHRSCDPGTVEFDACRRGTSSEQWDGVGRLTLWDSMRLTNSLTYSAEGCKCNMHPCSLFSGDILKIRTSIF